MTMSSVLDVILAAKAPLSSYDVSLYLGLPSGRPRKSVSSILSILYREGKVSRRKAASLHGRFARMDGRAIWMYAHPEFVWDAPKVEVEAPKVEVETPSEKAEFGPTLAEGASEDLSVRKELYQVLVEATYGKRVDQIYSLLEGKGIPSWILGGPDVRRRIVREAFDRGTRSLLEELQGSSPTPKKEVPPSAGRPLNASNRPLESYPPETKRGQVLHLLWDHRIPLQAATIISLLPTVKKNTVSASLSKFVSRGLLERTKDENGVAFYHKPGIPLSADNLHQAQALFLKEQA